MYGHGLFGDYTEVHTRDVRTLGTDHGVMTCATDFIGMSEDDVGPVAIPALPTCRTSSRCRTASSRDSSTSSTWAGR